MATTGKAKLVSGSSEIVDKSVLSFVNCGKILPSFEMSIRDDEGNELGDYVCGRICLRGDSVMSGYFQNKDATEEVLDEHGWLDTGDIGFRIGDDVVVTARRKDVIIVNGRNIWPHDLEFLAESLPECVLGMFQHFPFPMTSEQIML